MKQPETKDKLEVIDLHIFNTFDPEVFRNVFIYLEEN
jgi:hypothetical protein